MKKNIKNIIFCFLFIFFAWPALAQEKVNLYFFYGNGCPHCAKEEKFLDKLERENENIEIFHYEVWQNRENAALLKKIANELNLDVAGVPFVIIGEETIVGYYNEAITGAEIKKIINNYLANGCNDQVAGIIGIGNGADECVHKCALDDEECLSQCGCEASEAQNEMPKIINVPVFGKVETASLSLPVLTILIAAIDGFNPCAMWVLLFLISLLLGMRDKKRMWLLGSAFVLSSGAVYFLFLSAWLNLFLFLGFVFWVRILIALTAMGSGGYHLWDAWKNRDGGCHVTGSAKRKLVFEKLRQIATQQSFWLALIGIIALAGAVNLVELVCSAGLPAVYTQILALSNLPSWQYYGYLLLYIFIFMLDDLLVFFIAMTTLQMKAASSKYTRYSSLVGGVIMIIIGLLLLFKPGWLMFG
ncbi:MAG: thioredoxin family protein [Patescibacteria group bacterium]|nr:thioredoxin family protein [Patescibacteria group bacterium]